MVIPPSNPKNEGTKLTLLHQPPKRKQPAASTPAAPKPTPKRRSKLAKENSISASEEAEIQEAFDLFCKPDPNSKEGVLAALDVRRCLVALNAPPSDAAEMRELLDTVDPEHTGWVGYEHFVAIAALKLRARGEDPGKQEEEVGRAYGLFTRGEEREITVGDLRRVAGELREEVPESVLRDMVREATGGGLGGVGREDFERVMRRAGVFG